MKKRERVEASKENDSEKSSDRDSDFNIFDDLNARNIYQIETLQINFKASISWTIVTDG